MKTIPEALRLFRRNLPRACALVAFGLFVWGCSTVSEQNRKLAEAHLGLAHEALSAGDPRGALAEIEKAVEADPRSAEVRNYYGLLLHVSFGEIERAVEQYRRAIALRPDFSEAKVNLGAAYTALNLCEDAIPLLEEVRKDLLYREPYLAENNLGWCKYQLGDEEAALRHLYDAVSLNSRFCLGYRNIGLIHEERGRLAEALQSFDRFVEACPESAEAHYRRGLVLLEQGKLGEAREAFARCQEHAGIHLKDECARRAALWQER